MDLSTLRASVERWAGILSSRIEVAQRKVFNSVGLIDTPIKEWYGTTTSVNGVFSFDISKAGFVQILHVDPQPIYNSESFNSQPYAALNTVSLIGITGKVVMGAAGVFKSDAMQAAPNVTVMIKVTGR
ncbi:hypothetical protein D3C78_728460 [compost metagenome]